MEKNRTDKPLPPYIDYLFLMDYLKNYSSPKSKLTRMIKSGELIKIKRGLYLPGSAGNYSLKTLANLIYGPSYISFEYALSYYSLIPEKVHSLTSASFRKNKNKLFKTPAGIFYYKYTRPAVYPYGVTRIIEEGHPCIIAVKEKALCDTLSKINGIHTMDALASLLHDDLRIEPDDLKSMNKDSIRFLSPLYGKKILRLFDQYIHKGI